MKKDGFFFSFFPLFLFKNKQLTVHLIEEIKRNKCSNIQTPQGSEKKRVIKENTTTEKSIIQNKLLRK